MNTCLTCGTETKHPKYCSRSCAATANNTGRRRHGRGPVPCQGCGTSTTNPKFCSAECQVEHKYQKMIGEWISGLRDVPGRYSLRRFLTEKQNDECSMCGIGPTWNEQSLVFETDHIDGDHTNNRPENLRLLCPNCHSQTPTFKAKNKGRGRPHRRSYS